MPMTCTGTVVKVIFYNPNNGWAVAVFRTEGRRETAVGTMPGIYEGAVIRISGEYVDHAKYGKQIHIDSYEEQPAVTEQGVRNYLKGGMVNGIGKTYADRIVDTFGTETFDILHNHPERLLEINGIGEKRLEKIKEGWKEQQQLPQIIAVLTQYGVSAAYAFRIYKQYGDESIHILKTDPYRMIKDVDGISFKTADSIALKTGVPRDSYSRLCSGIMFVLEDTAGKEGNCFVRRPLLLEEAENVLEADKETVENALEQAIADGTVIQEEDRMYSSLYYYTEKKVARLLTDIMTDCRPEYTEPDYNDPDIEYNETQKDAIMQAVNSPAFYITGGPGTGKTTIVKAIIRSFGAKRKVLLAAPTGRAAKRLEESTGHEAMTIHRLLEADFGSFKRNENRPIEGDVLIVDECSMIDLHLMNSLLKAIPKNMQLILIGDADQLPSVGPGTVLRDIIASEAVPGVKLTEILRQAQNSDIIVNSHRIIEGRPPELRQLTHEIDNDFYFWPESEEPAQTAENIAYLCRDIIPKNYGIPSADIQVLAPMHAGECGVDNLNIKLQEYLNPHKGGIKIGKYTFREGDRVMQMHNDYKKNVFNGDVGFITKFDRDLGEIEVTFTDSGRTVEYTRNELEDLMLAYAATIHKSQGSEYDAVIIAVLGSAYFMMNRNLLYTAVTRAKKLCILIGKPGNIAGGAKKPGSVARNTTLTQRLQEENGKKGNPT